jgi:hypothetical protein
MKKKYEDAAIWFLQQEEKYKKAMKYPKELKKKKPTEKPINTDRDNVISIGIVKKRFQIEVKKGVSEQSAFMTFVENDDLNFSFSLGLEINLFRFKRKIINKKSNIYEFIMVPADKTKCITKLLKEKGIIQ